MRSLKLFSALVITIVISQLASAQYVQPMRYPNYSIPEQVNIGSGVVRVTDPSAYLEIGPTSGGNKGVLLPRLTTTQRDAIASPTTGLIIYNTTSNQFNYYNGSTWTTFSSGAAGGGISQLGNTGNLWMIKVNDSTYAFDTASANNFYRSLFVPSSRTITINGTTKDLATNQTWTISGSGQTSRFDSSYTPLGGNRGSEYITKSVRFRVNNVTISPTQFGDSAMLWNIDVPTVYIDSVYRTPGKDSIFARYAGGTILRMKDSIGGGAGSQTLQQTTDLGDSTTNRIVSNDSLKSQDAWVHGSVFVGDTLYARGDSLIAFGTSITAGSGVSGIQRFSYLLAQRYGMIEANYGGGGNPIDALSGSLYKIPAKTSNRGAIMIEYNMNDASSSDTSTWKTKMITIIDTAIARGWTSNKIIIVGGPYSQESTRPYLSLYVRAARTVSELKNTKFIDAYSFMQSRGGTALTYDSTHPTALGHVVIFEAAKTAFLEFKKIGLVDVSGSIYGRKAIFAGTPPTASTYPYNASFINTGKASFHNRIYVGTDTTGYGNSALINISASSGQTGLSVKDNGNSAYTHIQGGEIQAVNSSGHLMKYGPSSIVVGNGSLDITGSAGRKLLWVGVYGGVVVNEDGNTDDFRIEGDNQTHLFYTNGTNDRIGIRTNTPDSNLTVNGSVRLASTVRLSGLPTGKKAFQIYADANGTLYRGDSTVGGGGGGGTTYKIGTYNSQTPNGDGASIVGDSIYMQAFSAEIPGLVPAGGDNTKFLRGDGTWQVISSGGLTKGTTTISSSATTRVLYDSSGILSNNALFTYNANGELLTGTSTDAGDYKLQVGGKIYTNAASGGLFFNGTVQRIEHDGNAIYAFANSTFYIGTTAGYAGTFTSNRLFVGGSTTAHSTLQTGGSFAAPVSAKTGTYTIGATDYTITADATSGAFTITLPTAASISGRTYIIKKTDSSGNAVTVGTTSSQTIDGATTYSLASQYKYVKVQSNGSNWIIIGSN